MKRFLKMHLVLGILDLIFLQLPNIVWFKGIYRQAYSEHSHKTCSTNSHSHSQKKALLLFVVLSMST